MEPIKQEETEVTTEEVASEETSSKKKSVKKKNTEDSVPTLHSPAKAAEIRRQTAELSKQRRR